jgi:hypothetical protein
MGNMTLHIKPTADGHLENPDINPTHYVNYTEICVLSACAVLRIAWGCWP